MSAGSLADLDFDGSSSTTRCGATRHYWLGDFFPTPASVADLLIEAIGGSDRASLTPVSVIVEVAALVFGTRIPRAVRLGVTDAIPEGFALSS